MYTLAYDKRIVKDLKNIPASFQVLLLRKIQLLAEHPRRPGVEKLSGVEGYRFRVGDYRVLFQIEDEIKAVTVYRIKHRRDVYRGL